LRQMRDTRTPHVAVGARQVFRHRAAVRTGGGVTPHPLHRQPTTIPGKLPDCLTQDVWTFPILHATNDERRPTCRRGVTARYGKRGWNESDAARKPPGPF